ncbi:MAG: energy-coupling factor transporter ATPase [Lachnospiraceae bacterium]|nr:energy-coupling factor transporter ATPase [Lachnospiraceae bacterium]
MKKKPGKKEKTRSKEGFSALLRIKDLKYEYIRRDEENNVEGITTAVDGVSMEVKPGEFIAILGHNGSGKSTLAKHINAILFPAEGTVVLDGMDTQDEDRLLDIRRTAGMVFQNPDNQIIGQVVDEDVAFGPENMGVPTEEIISRVEESLKTIGMWEYRDASPNHLSGGQKQRVSIAGVLAMHPKCLILDEPTAMLDPRGRYEVIRAARALNQVEGITVILITHYMEEAVYADRIFVMDQGKVVMNGDPRSIFSRVEELKELRLGVPVACELGWELRKSGLPLPEGILNRKELVEALKDIPHKSGGGAAPATVSEKPEPEGGMKLIADKLSYKYDKGTNKERCALEDVSFVLHPGEFVGLIGHTGSGKSTLVQLLNALLTPDSGSVYYDGADIYAPDYDRKALRGKVGMVFQYPEHQLFEETVLSEVAYGPKNMGLDRKEAELAAFAAIKKVGLEDECFDQSPFDLSGGQKRRVAIASVLAMKPELLILDEPAAGLDPAGREELLSMIRTLRDEEGICVLLVSHSMEDVAELADRILVLDKGKLLYDDTPRRVFAHAAELEEIGLAAPETSYILKELEKTGWELDTEALTLSEAKERILEATA